MTETRYKYDNYFLIVEDDQEIAGMIKKSLNEAFESCFVIISPSAADAKRRLGLQKFQAIIVDLNLEKSSGEDVASFVRDKNEFNKDTPLIICSGHIDPERLTLLAQFTKNFFVKPFSSQELITKVEMLVQEYKEKESPKSYNAS